jgi:Protein of unknown function (DUF3175)
MGDASISSTRDGQESLETSSQSTKVGSYRHNGFHPSAARATFAGSASEIARTMARKDVSPRGVGSGIQMIQYFINRGGKNLSAARRAELEKAKRLLQRRAARQKAASKKR